MDTGYFHRRIWSPIRAELDLNCRPHDLRHTLRTILSQHAGAGKVRSEEIDQFFGWSKGDVPFRYTHLHVNDTRPVAEAMDHLASGSLEEVTG